MKPWQCLAENEDEVVVAAQEPELLTGNSRLQVFPSRVETYDLGGVGIGALLGLRETSPPRRFPPVFLLLYSLPGLVLEQLVAYSGCCAGGAGMLLAEGKGGFGQRHTLSAGNTTLCRSAKDLFLR